MAKIGEVLGVRIDNGVPATPPETWKTKECPYTGGGCDVTSNRSNMSYLEPPKNATVEERERFTDNYGPWGKPHFPFAICSVSTTRRSAQHQKPWIVCPKRMLDLKLPHSPIPPEIRELAPGISTGSTVRLWWEVKFTHKEEDGSGHFEYTFDFLFAPTEKRNGKVRFAGPPYAIEVMTASTRGGGLTEHLWDALQCKPPRPLKGEIDSPYTPNYRQVFGRMLSQFFVKCETLSQWGGRAIWLLQDELLEYIEESTSFSREKFRGAEGPGTFVVYTMEDSASEYQLKHLETITGPTRPSADDSGQSFMTDMVGAGYVPPLSALEEMLLIRPRAKAASNYRDLVW